MLVNKREIKKRLRGSFWRGVGSLASFGQGVEMPSLGDWRDDVEAMRSDWQAVGDDLRAAISQFDPLPRPTVKKEQ